MSHSNYVPISGTTNMQDMARDHLTCDKDIICPTHNPTSSDLFVPSSSWQQHQLQSTDAHPSKLLLQSSDDPLISRGASVMDDNDMHLDQIVPPLSTSSSPHLLNPNDIETHIPKRPRSATQPRQKRKGTFKLRFHHQALPAEYLSHYEATQGQLIKKDIEDKKAAALAKPSNSHENVKNWLKNVASIHQKNTTVEAPPDINQNTQRTYSDLPYMGEMTLENMKPRRGRKPKKADICHLIYKNYGTMPLGKLPPEKTEVTLKEPLKKLEEPLNLCMRDQSDSVSVSSLEGSDADSQESTDPATHLKNIVSNGKAKTLLANSIYSKLLEVNKMNLPPGVETVTNGNNLSLKIPIKFPEGLTAPSNMKSSPQPTVKRKRSAIFIPPLPSESSTNHATEVSICKFKFTGGARPSLQEKKMLSVDSDGNYRYYNGTGDKSMRGYEFFPRESIQQGIQGKQSPTLLNDIPPPSSDLSNELLQIPDSPTNNLLLSPIAGYSTTDRGLHQLKKKMKKSSQRENLEKTFKEKGFLIQTQQLESAEGATYCKFRQLKKFTRYLFRNWKDYLPGDVQLQEANVAFGAAAAAAVATNSEDLLHPLPHPSAHDEIASSVGNMIIREVTQKSNEIEIID